jgi:hypothetical protein
MVPARLLAAALACAAAGAAAARERPPPPGGEEVRGLVALRLGAALPMGDARDQLRMDDLVAGAVPVGLELAARGGRTTLGFLVEYGRGLGTRRCPAGATCSASVTRAGIELLHRFSGGSGGSGWVGGGLGWEGTSATLAGRSTRLDSLELLNLQAGRDFAAGRGLLLGPFVAATFAQGMSQDGKDIKQKSPHTWLQLGIRVELGP